MDLKLILMVVVRIDESTLLQKNMKKLSQFSVSNGQKQESRLRMHELTMLLFLER